MLDAVGVRQSQVMSEASSGGDRSLLNRKWVINKLLLPRLCHALERAVPDVQVNVEALLSLDVKPLGVVLAHSYSYSSGVSTLAV